MMYDNFWGICLALPTMLHFTPTGQATSVEAVLPLSMSVQCIHSGTSEIITRWVYTDTVHPLWTKAQAGLHRWPLKNTGLKSMGPPPQKKRKEKHGSTYRQMVFNKNILKILGNFLTTTEQLYELHWATMKQSYWCFFIIMACIVIPVNRYKLYEFLFHIIFSFWYIVLEICVTSAVFCVI